MIRLENVSKAFGRQRVLEDFSLSVARGERVALMGRSGGGKTTLIRMVLGLEKPDSGSVAINSQKPSVVFQEDRLIEHLSAIGNVSVVLESSPDEEKLLGIFDAVGLDRELIYKPVSRLSGGERRRVCIARAIAHEGDLLIFDEAFKGIDEDSLEVLYGRLGAMLEGKSLLLITHSKEEANRLCQRIIEL